LILAVIPFVLVIVFGITITTTYRPMVVRRQR
jgi:hypothetical protein